MIAHWLVSGLPLALLAPVLGIQFDLSAEALCDADRVAMLIGTPALSGIGAIGAALTLGVRGGGVLLSLLVLPLYIPVLIFGAGAVDATVSGLGAQAHLSLLPRWRWPGVASPPVAHGGRLTDRPANEHRTASTGTDSPARQAFYPLAGTLIPWFWALAAIFGIAGLYVGMLVAPTDFAAGRGLPHHLHARAGLVDVDVHLPGDGLLGRPSAWPSTPASPA